MAYTELVKNLNVVRAHMREFFVYGFRSRSECALGSARRYDDVHRRIESWLGEFMMFRRDQTGKRVFLSTDSRQIRQNPLFLALTAKGFTNTDITLHFFLLDILRGKSDHRLGRYEWSLPQIMNKLTKDYLSFFESSFLPDAATIRNKLKEYTELGIIASKRDGRLFVYHLSEDHINIPSWLEAITFFTEECPLGFLGFTLKDRLGEAPAYYLHKHSYMLHVLDSEVMCNLLLAIEGHDYVEMSLTEKNGKKQLLKVTPLQIHIRVQGGRSYLAAYSHHENAICFYRLDYIAAVVQKGQDSHFFKHMFCLEKMRKHLWGVSTGDNIALVHLEMTLRVEDGETYFINRLLQEKRGGYFTQIDQNTMHYAVDVYDAIEMLPWLRKFIGRILDFHCSDPSVEELFFGDLCKMAAQYGGASHALP